MKYFILIILLNSAATVFAAGPYMVICQNSKISLSVKRDLKYDGVINGWKQYWTQVDYTVSDKSGTLDAHISWRKDSRPDYNVLMISLMDKDEAAYRKKGIEGGSVGFGAIDSREEIKGRFKATWSTYKNSMDAPELQSDRVELLCEVQK